MGALYRAPNPELIVRRSPQRRKDPTKAKISALTRARTGMIGLKAFLFKMRVPEIPTSLSMCGEAPETAGHLFEASGNEKRELARLGRKEELLEKFSTGKWMLPLLRWHMKKLPEYTVALTIEDRQLQALGNAGE